MKKTLITLIIILSSLFSQTAYCYDDFYIYDYFILNEKGLNKEQLGKIIELQNIYHPKFNELRQKIYIEKLKIDLEMCKEKPNKNLIDESINLNMNYKKELKKLSNEFLQEYKKIKENI